MAEQPRQTPENKAGFLNWEVHTWRNGQAVDEPSLVVREEPLVVSIEGSVVGVLMRTPGMDRELAVGYCLGEGMIAGASDIGSVHQVGSADAEEPDGESQEPRNRVEILLAQDSTARLPEVPVRLIRTGCGRVDPVDLSEGVARLPDGFTVPERSLRETVRGLAALQERYRVAGGIHAAGVFGWDGKPIIVCEDIGRHNAVDKVLGYCALRGIATGDKVVLCTGRASYDLVAKAARHRVPVLASLSSPTSLAVELAAHLNVALLGYVRPDRFTVYTGNERIQP